MEFIDKKIIHSSYSDGIFYSKNTRINPFLEKAVSGIIPGVAIDFGCGIGTNSKFLRNNGWDVYAIDREIIAIENVLKILPRSRVYKEDIIDIDYSRLPMCKLITCNYVMQHMSIEEAKATILNMLKLLIRDGLIVFSIFSRNNCIDFDLINSIMKSNSCILKDKKEWIRKDVDHGPVHLHKGIEGLWIKR